MLSSSRPAGFIFSWLFLVTVTGDARATTGCPPIHNGKPLQSMEVFDGPPEEAQPQAPEGNRWIIHPIPASLWGKYPPFYLACRYHGVTGIVAVQLPRNTRVCETREGSNVQCR